MPTSFSEQWRRMLREQCIYTPNSNVTWSTAADDSNITTLTATFNIDYVELERYFDHIYGKKQKKGKVTKLGNSLD